MLDRNKYRLRTEPLRSVLDSLRRPSDRRCTERDSRSYNPAVKNRTELHVVLVTDENALKVLLCRLLYRLQQADYATFQSANRTLLRYEK